RAWHRIGNVRPPAPANIARQHFAGGWEGGRPGVVPERARIRVSSNLDAGVLGQEVKRRLELEAGAPIRRAAQRVAQETGERELGEVAGSDAGRSKSAYEIWAHLEMVEHPQSAVAPSGDPPALEMEYADDVRDDLVIAVDVACGADELHV